MRSEIPLDPDQLEAVFDRLDTDGNGYLTLEEFADGFGEYLGLECAMAASSIGNSGNKNSVVQEEDLQMETEPPQQVSSYNILVDMSTFTSCITRERT